MAFRFKEGDPVKFNIPAIQELCWSWEVPSDVSDYIFDPDKTFYIDSVSLVKGSTRPYRIYVNERAHWFSEKELLSVSGESYENYLDSVTEELERTKKELALAKLKLELAETELKVTKLKLEMATVEARRAEAKFDVCADKDIYDKIYGKTPYNEDE